MKLYIKYMVTLRCRMQVRNELNNLGHPLVVFDMGTVEILDDLPTDHREQFEKKIRRSGMLLLNEEKSTTMDEAKRVIAYELSTADPNILMDIQNALLKNLNISIKEITDLFSEVKGISLNQYISTCRIELVKELLLYHDLTLDEIAHKLHFTNRANLSYQFKKITGLTPAYYKLIKEKRRRNQLLLDEAAKKQA